MRNAACVLSVRVQPLHFPLVAPNVFLDNAPRRVIAHASHRPLHRIILAARLPIQLQPLARRWRTPPIHESQSRILYSDVQRRGRPPFRSPHPVDRVIRIATETGALYRRRFTVSDPDLNRVAYDSSQSFRPIRRNLVSKNASYFRVNFCPQISIHKAPLPFPSFFGAPFPNILVFARPTLFWANTFLGAPFFFWPSLFWGPHWPSLFHNIFVFATRCPNSRPAAQIRDPLPKFSETRNRRHPTDKRHATRPL